MITTLKERHGHLTHANELREYLLPLTVAHAVQKSKFYKERLGDYVGCIKQLNDLQNLPFLHKAEIVAHIDEMRTFDKFPDYLMYTSGTTSSPLEVPVYQEEIEAYNQLVLPIWREKFKNEVPLTLAVLRVGHGTHILTRQIPTIPCHINYGLDQLISMLKTEHWVAGRQMRVSNLEANVLNLRQITNELFIRGIDPKSFGLETISVSGWYLTDWERRFMQDTWGALLLDRYGVTEIHGDAKWCHACGYYHFDFTVIPEVLDIETGEAIDNGIGQMVITGLFPFNQAVPKIRYLIGDLVEIHKTDCRSSEHGVRFLSRIKDAVLAPINSKFRYMLFSTNIAEALAPFPDIARKEHTGFLKFNLSSPAPGRASIEVELTYPPAAFPSRVVELKAHIMRALERQSGAVGEVELEFVRPNQLNSITKV